MKKGLLVVIFALFTVHVTSQVSFNYDVKVGDVFYIGNPAASEYQYLETPRANFIIKKGGIADFKTLLDEKVVVTAMGTKRGKTHVTLKRKDGKKFFGSHSTIKAYLSEAISSKELIKPE